MRLRSLTLVIALAIPVLSVHTAHGSHAAQSSATTPCGPSQQIGASEIQGVATGGELWAATSGMVTAGVQSKIVLKFTGTGALQLDAAGPNGQVITPARTELHLPGASSWNHPGDEWGTIWDFPTAGCWQVRASRDDVTGSFWLDAVPPSLDIAGFSITQRGHKGTTLLARTPANFILHVSSEYSSDAIARVVIRQAGRQYTAFKMDPASDPGKTGTFHHRMQFSVTVPTRFTAIATSRIGPTSARRTLAFTVKL